ncbi:MAG TPA: DUF6766 family protein [Gemmatimonadaceae bacterium]|nr:DUF6766 family protein [Gemmatimonadaceae bacterium]
MASQDSYFEMKMWKNNGLSIALFSLFLVSFVGHSLSGWKAYNHDQQEHGEIQIGYVEYLETSDFGESVFENWESEFLQMAFYILLTVALYQKGSAESKSPGEKEDVDEDPEKHRNDPDAPGPVKAGGWRLALYKNSLSLALLLLFLFSFLGHAAAGARHYTEEGQAHGAHETVGMFGYMATAQFWYESFQNWQSEFLSVFAIVVLSIWLRQWGSPESKPVHTAHHEGA